MHEVRPHPSGSDGTGDDVVMEAENAGERSAGDSNPIKTRQQKEDHDKERTTGSKG